MLAILDSPPSNCSTEQFWSESDMDAAREHNVGEIIDVEEGEDMTMISEDFEDDVEVAAPSQPRKANPGIWEEQLKEYQEWKESNGYVTEEDADFEPSQQCMESMQQWKNEADERMEAEIHSVDVGSIPQYFKRLLEKYKRSGNVKHRSYTTAQKNALNVWMAHEYSTKPQPIWYDASKKTGISRQVLMRMWQARHIRLSFSVALLNASQLLYCYHTVTFIAAVLNACHLVLLF